MEMIASGNLNVSIDIKNIANISQETSASSQEVAVSNQEQYTYIQHISSLAEELFLTSIELQKMIKQFDLVFE